ncbi:magnesium transporter [Methanolobus bombayensis]|uniref:magnesium transporter n=1 Tax=Methanolobus bombayensis TaxID=38023 RepID=UPI001AEB4846|nr:magnesium transporter [Methanolobus bombayensis]MBP1909166.1 mgtE-like transporter [Methanolobus bombayensis]
MSYYTVNGILKRGFPILLVTSIIGIFSGQILNIEIEKLVSMPIILVLIPALIKIGGDTGSMLGARLSSSFHMGLGSHIHRNPVVRNSVIAALIVGLSACVFVAITVWLVGLLFNMAIAFPKILALCMIAGTFELLVVFSATIAIAFASHKFGVDPDDTVIPLIATFGDLIGVSGIFITMQLLNLM